jgi:Flp pilus assembly protein TadG
MTVWAIGLAFLAFTLCGVIVDIGGALTAKTATLDAAQQAARAGAQHLDLTGLRRDGRIRLDPAAARASAQTFLAQAGMTGTVTATPAQVQVTARSTHRTVLLPVLGVRSIPITATAVAVPATR